METFIINHFGYITKIVMALKNGKVTHFNSVCKSLLLFFVVRLQNPLKLKKSKNHIYENKSRFYLNLEWFGMIFIQGCRLIIFVQITRYFHDEVIIYCTKSNYD